MKTSSFTIVIPTHNRPELLKKLITRLLRCGIDHVPIIVMDSSTPENKERNKKSVKLLGEYGSYFGYDEDFRFFIKAEHTIKHIKTNYMCYCADDDFVNVAALDKCAQFLDLNPDYAACHGRYLTFEEKDGKTNFEKIEYAGPSIDSEYAYERIVNLFMNYEATTYALIRTDVQREIIRLAILPDIKMHRELMTAMVLAIYGKIKRIDDIFYLRAPTLNSEKNDEYEITQSIIKNIDGLAIDFKKFRELIVNHAASIGGEDRSPDLIRSAINFGYLSFSYFYTDLRKIMRTTLPAHVAETHNVIFSVRKPAPYVPLKVDFYKERFRPAVRPYFPNIVVRAFKPLFIFLARLIPLKQIAELRRKSKERKMQNIEIADGILFNPQLAKNISTEEIDSIAIWFDNDN